LIDLPFGPAGPLGPVKQIKYDALFS